MDELVQRLSQGDHPIRASRVESAAALKESIDRGVVLFKFTDTRGGTELSARFDPAASDLTRGDFAAASGAARIVGTLTLNYLKVALVADIDLATLAGTGRLEVRE